MHFFILTKSYFISRFMKKNMYIQCLAAPTTHNFSKDVCKHKQYLNYFFKFNFSLMVIYQQQHQLQITALEYGIKKVGEFTKKFPKLIHPRLSRSFSTSKKAGSRGICDALGNLIPFVHFEKRKKHPWLSFTFSKLQLYLN